MANTSLFKSIVGKLVPATNTRNEAGGSAYAFTPRHALAQYATTGCLTRTYYASAETQLEKVLGFARQVAPEFLAKTAVYAREAGFMKDMPALLCAVLATPVAHADIEPGTPAAAELAAANAARAELLKKIFPRVIDNGRMLRNFVQIIRSGQTGRKSLGSLPKRLVVDWLNAATDKTLFEASVGNAPSLADVIRMVHPRPADPARAALYGYLIDQPHDAALLPEQVRDFEAYKAGATRVLPKVPFQMLTALELGKAEWTSIAETAPWHMTRMNLNTFARHGVFDNNDAIADTVAARLRNAEAIGKARVFPYQLLAAYLASASTREVPRKVTEALQDAMEIATANVPVVQGKVWVLPDVSGSMSCPVNGYGTAVRSKVRCIDVAALIAATILRKNPEAQVLPFDTEVRNVTLNPRDSVMTNAHKLARLQGGGTSCSAPLIELNRRRAQGDLVIYVSDNESWMDTPRGRGTCVMQAWKEFKKRNPNAKLVCIDLQPYGSTQAEEADDILNVGGFSDHVFTIVRDFAEGNLSPAHWVGEIEKIAL
ncbi:RNA-binding protein [Verrucomicrobia bacterium LW23]|nr:RNA-binding protein [Verrucomicrobia bacterium LW23]